MYYMDQLKKELAELPAKIKAAGASEWSADHLLHMANYFIEQMTPEVAYGERAAAALEHLGVEDEKDLALLEKLNDGSMFHYESNRLRELVQKSLGEVAETLRDSERDFALNALDAAGFQEDENDSDWMERNSDGKRERILIEWQRKEDAYFFMYEVNDREVIRGKSGEFQKLLEAAGVTPKEVVK